MSKFNNKAMSNAIGEYHDIYGIKRTPKKHQSQGRTRNFEDGQAFTMSPEMDLYSRVCTMGLSNKFYQSESDQMDELKGLIYQCNPTFVAKLAVYAREKMYLRSIPLVLAVELAKIHRGDQLVSRLVSRVIKRADELAEILAYYQKANHRGNQTKKLNKLSNQIKKGIRQAFEDGRFNEYQYGKYNSGKEVKLRDALFLTHPNPKDEAQKELFGKIADDTLDIPYTWETQLSEAGQTGTNKCKVWEKLINDNKLGYMAMIRNIRNFLKEEVSSECIDIVCDTLADRDNVLKSKQLPFRFLSAYRALVDPIDKWSRHYKEPQSVESPYTRRLIEALETAISHSIENLPLFGDSSILCVTDVSGSMQSPVSPKSKVLQYDIGAMLCMIANKSSKNSCAGMFGSEFKVIDTGGKILQNVQEIYKREGEVGYATHGYKVLEWALGQKVEYERIMIFTDCQLYGRNDGYNSSRNISQLWGLYRQKYPRAKLYLFDLGGYGTTPVEMMDNGVNLISGWSDKVFDVLDRVEMGQSALDEIESISL